MQKLNRWIFISVFSLIVLVPTAGYAQDATQKLSLTEKVDLLLRKYDQLKQAKQTLEEELAEARGRMEQVAITNDELEKRHQTPSEAQPLRHLDKLLAVAPSKPHR